MVAEHEFTVHVEETESGSYRARLAAAPEDHYAVGEDPLVAVRGALAVARETVDAAFAEEGTVGRGRVASE